MRNKLRRYCKFTYSMPSNNILNQEFEQLKKDIGSISVGNVNSSEIY